MFVPGIPNSIYHNLGIRVNKTKTEVEVRAQPVLYNEQLATLDELIQQQQVGDSISLTLARDRPRPPSHIADSF